MSDLTRVQARELLTEWKMRRDAVLAERDTVVLLALGAELDKAEIHRITGVARTTINDIASAAAQ